MMRPPLGLISQASAITSNVRRRYFEYLRITYSTSPVSPFVPRMLSAGPMRLYSSSSFGQLASDTNKHSSTSESKYKNEDASRAELWNQMLNTIIVEPRENPTDGTSSSYLPKSTLSHSRVPSGAPRRDGSSNVSSMVEQLDTEFRDRPTFGLPKPCTPTTGRSLSMTSTYNNTSATLYRQLSQILNRNNVRRELRLNERYEKPNQMRRRKRSERHRRRFADMVRKKVQLVRALPLRVFFFSRLTLTDYDAEST